jgi:hypothetical protein
LARDARESIGVLTLVGWVREKKGDSTIRILIDDGGRKGRLMEEIWACGLMKGWRRGLRAVGWVVSRGDGPVVAGVHQNQGSSVSRGWDAPRETGGVC